MIPSEIGCNPPSLPRAGRSDSPPGRGAVAGGSFVASVRRLRRAVQRAAFVALALSPLCPVAAHGQQPSATDRRQAEALFGEAKRLMAAGKVAEACRKLEGSYRIDPAGGTILNLALCHEKEGKIATAWAELKEALAAAKKASRKDREKIAREHIDAIEPRLPYVLVIPAQPDTKELEVTVDEGAIAREAWGAQIPIDPGSHTAKAVAPGREPWEAAFEVAEGKKVTVRVPALAVAAAPKLTASADASASIGPPPLRYPWMRPSGIAVASVGVVAVVVGAVFGGRALSLGSDAKKECPGGACSDAGLAAVQDGRTSATAADILLGAGAGFTALGAVLFLVGGVTEAAPAGTGAATGAARAGDGRASRAAGTKSQGVAPLVRVSTSGAILGLEGAW